MLESKNEHLKDGNCSSEFVSLGWKSLKNENVYIFVRTIKNQSGTVTDDNDRYSRKYTSNIRFTGIHAWARNILL